MTIGFDGKNGFYYAYGVVEDRFDPLFLGRCKVRYIGWHTKDKSQLPTEELPWSYPLVPLDPGKNVVGPLEGQWVFAYFMDGESAQEPIMLGTLLGIPESLADPSKGFNDPRPDSVLVGHQVPREPDKLQQYDDGSGNDITEQDKKSRFPDENYLKEPHAARYARGYEGDGHIEKTVVPLKIANVGIGQTDVPTANHPAGTGSDVASPGTEFTEEETPYNAKYPYNHVYLSEGNHLLEVDDTPGYERLHWYHRSGSFKEIHPSGLTVEKIVDQEYRIVLRHRFTHIEASDNHTVDWGMKVYVNKDGKPGFNYDLTVGPNGDLNLTTEDGKFNVYVNGDANIYVDGNAFVEVEHDLVATVHQNVQLHVDQNVYATIKGDLNAHVGGNANIHVDGDLTETVDGNVTAIVQGSKTEYIVGNYTKIVGGNIQELAGGNIERLAAGNITDDAVGTCNRIAVTVNDFGTTINHTAPTTNCSGLLTGITTDSDGDTTTAGPAQTPPSIDVNATIAGAVVDAAALVTGKDDPQSISAIVLAATLTLAQQQASESAEAAKANQESAASGNGSGSGSGGYKGPYEPVDGVDQGFLWKPISDSNGNLVILYTYVVDDGVSLYTAIPDGVETKVIKKLDENGVEIEEIKEIPKYRKGDFLEKGQFTGAAYNGRSFYRFRKPGPAYSINGAPIIVDVDGKEIVITKPEKRYD